MKSGCCGYECDEVSDRMLWRRSRLIDLSLQVALELLCQMNDAEAESLAQNRLAKGNSVENRTGRRDPSLDLPTRV